MERLVPLEGGRNFRDLGGYRTGDGRRVRWRVLFRSGVLSYLTAEDWRHLSGLGVRTVCDLRAPHERAREPVQPRPADVQWDEWDYDSRDVSLRSHLTAHAMLTPETARSSITALYRELPARFAAQFAGIFQRLVAGSTPLIINCSAGKDRTGVASALVLSSLGVVRDDVLADYVLTNEAVDLERELFTHPRSTVGVGGEHEHLTRLAPDVRVPLLAAHAEYLEAAYEQIDADYGSVTGFVRDCLGVSDIEVGGLRDRLLEPD
jgi:protein-tyrosine phosphatase